MDLYFWQKTCFPKKQGILRFAKKASWKKEKKVWLLRNYMAVPGINQQIKIQRGQRSAQEV